ncbi:adenylyltransferase/cytidyltransferase family protein [Candidatus Peregrinibacteria bacterium]|nr:adenylyltransferase/cytidyltransferase family protein [Candidatus Peregrinibacteria bacterium]
MRILVFGTFDHLHPGHRFLLEAATSRGELWVVVARDANVRRIKGRLPDQGEEERKRSLEEAYPEAHIILGDPEDFLEPVRAIAPNKILLGYDQKLPPHVSMEDLPCPIDRLPAFEPHLHKSSVRRQKIHQMD